MNQIEQYTNTIDRQRRGQGWPKNLKIIQANVIYTGSKFFNQKIYIEADSDPEVNAALKSTFHDSFHRTAPLRTSRLDVITLLTKDELSGMPVAEQHQGQGGLFE